MDPASVEASPVPRNPNEAGDPCLAALRRWLLGQDGTLEEWLTPPRRRDPFSEGVRQWLEELMEYVDGQEPFEGSAVVTSSKA